MSGTRQCPHPDCFTSQVRAERYRARRCRTATDISRSISEGDARAELHLERARNGRRRSDPAQIPVRLAVRRRLILAGEIAIPEIGAVEDVVELGKQRNLSLESQREVLGYSCIEIDEGVPAGI